MEAAGAMDQDGEWLVSTPLAGIEVGEPVIELDQETILCPADIGEKQSPEGLADPSEDAFASEVRRILGDDISRPTRLLRFSRGASIDTRRGATILGVEHGSADLALAHARAKARYAISVWVILAPPDRWSTVPDVASWVPQPYVRIGQRYKRREHDVRPPGERTHGGRVDTYGPYRAPGADILRAPFEAYAARDRRCSRALLGASLGLLMASRGRQGQLSERLRDLHWAVETLCLSQPGAKDAGQRWQRLVKRLEIEHELAGGGGVPGDARLIARSLTLAGKVTASGADAPAIDLGWVPSEDRGRAAEAIAEPDDLDPLAMRPGLTLSLQAMSAALSRLWPLVRESGFDDAAFERQFA